MNVVKTEGDAGNRIAALAVEMAGVINDLPEGVNDRVRKKVASFLNTMILAESASETEAFHEMVSEAWQEVASSDTHSFQDVALKARATVLYREGVKTWSGDTFNDEDWPYIQQIIEDAAQFAIPD